VEPFFVQILSGMQATLSAQSIGLRLLVVGDTDAEIDTYRRWTSERRVDGVAMVDVLARDPRPAVLKQRAYRRSCSAVPAATACPGSGSTIARRCRP
jgi:DNA-binding LacI/PurR family transcriptional regulator